MATDEQISFNGSFGNVLPNRQLTLSGIMTVKNAVALGYPFLEAILHVLPIVDEFLIGDGGSTDKTVYYINRLKEMFPKVSLYETMWAKSAHWESFDEAVDFLISKTSGRWIFELHSDEFWHEKDIFKLLEIVKRADSEGYNSLRHPCVSYAWTTKDSYVYRNVRVLRKVPELSSHWGGDDFQVGSCRSPREGYTSHNVPPELNIDIELMHMSRAFLKHRASQDKANVGFIGTGSEERKRSYEDSRQREEHWSRAKPPKKGDVLSCLPALMKGLSQELEYKVRGDILFDKQKLSELTGLNYD